MKALYTLFFMLFLAASSYGQENYKGMIVKWEQGKCGLVDSQGKELIPIKYEDIKILNDTLFSVRLNRKYGLINRSEKEIVPLEYNYISGIYKNLILLIKYDFVTEKIEEYRLINSSGKEIVTLSLDDENLNKNHIGRYYENGQVVVKINGKYGLYNSQGEILPPQYDSIYIYYSSWALTKSNDKYEIYNFKGEKITFSLYDYISFGSDSQAVAQIDGQSGYIDLDTGTFVSDKKAEEEIALQKRIKEESDLIISAKYPDEKQTFVRYISNELRYPELAEYNNIEGKVTLRFIVEKDGSVSNISFSGLLNGYGLEEEGIRVLKISKKWIPSILEGKPVRLYFLIPISFKLP